LKGLLLTLLLLLAALSQAAVAPLFPVSGATPDFLLAAVVVSAVFAGPRMGMAAVPIVALFYAFAVDRSPGLVLVAYLPLLPLAAYASEAGLPLNRFAQTLLAGVATGMWARLVFALAAMAQGAEPAVGLLLGAVLLPGLFLDLALLSLVYLPLRAVRLDPRPLTLRRSEYGLG
jgi:hypothetical protein